MKCGSCDKDMLGDCAYIGCSGCSKRFHVDEICSGVQTDTWTAMSSLTEISWKCKICKSISDESNVQSNNSNQFEIISSKLNAALPELEFTKNKVIELEVTMTSLREDNEELYLKMDEMKENINQLEPVDEKEANLNELETLSGKLDDVVAELDVTIRKVIELETTVRSLKEHNEELVLKVDEMKETINELDPSINESETLSNFIMDEAEEDINQLEPTINEYETLSSKLDAALPALEMNKIKVTDLEFTVASLRDENKELALKVDEMEENITVLEPSINQCETLSSKLDVALPELEFNRNKVMELEYTVTSLRGENVELALKVEKVKEDMNQLEPSIKQYETLSSKLDAALPELEFNKNKVVELEIIVASLREENRELALKVDEVEDINQLEPIFNQYETLSSKLDTTLPELEFNRDKVMELEVTVASLREENKELALKVNEMKENINKLEPSINQYEALSSKLDASLLELEFTKNKIMEFEFTVTSLREENQKLTLKVEKMKERKINRLKSVEFEDNINQLEPSTKQYDTLSSRLDAALSELEFFKEKVIKLENTLILPLDNGKVALKVNKMEEEINQLKANTSNATIGIHGRSTNDSVVFKLYK